MINAQPSPTQSTLLRPVEPIQPLPHNTQPAKAPLDSTSLSPSKVRTVAARVRRDLQNPGSTADSRKASVRQFADALVEHSDQQLAIGVANSVIRQRLARETRRSSEEPDKVIVPPHSTFGQVWSELADALESEPFKSFAEAKLIETSNLIIGANGDLTEKVNGGLVSYFAPNDPEWSAVSAAVLAAAKKLAGAGYSEISFYGRTHASASNIAGFYGMQLGHISSNDTLSMAGQLLRDGNFAALSSTDPLDASIKQRQREARQRIVDLPTHALRQTLEPFAPLTAQQKVEQADRALAQQVSQGLMKLVPETAQYETSVILEDIPEYSTFSQVRKQLLNALNGEAFKTFAQDNDLDPTSVRINPVSGELTGQVRGANTTFTLNDVSGWADAWAEIQPAVQQMAAGSDSDVTYPTGTSAPLFEVMAFYNEAPPHQEDSRKPRWEQRQLAATLGRVVEINQNNSFKTLTDANQANDTQKRQQAVIQQLADTPVSPSPLESLAAAVQASTNETEESQESPADVLAKAEHELAIAVNRVMLELKADPAKATAKMIDSIPTNSLFGQSLAYLSKALNARGYSDWRQQNNLAVTGATWYAPKDEANLRASEAEFAKQFPEHFDVMNPVNAAAAPFAAGTKPVELKYGTASSVPFEWLCNFYGISTDPSSEKFAQQLELIGRTQQLPNRPESPESTVNRLQRQRTALGNSNDRYALINLLKKGNTGDTTARFVVSPDSSHQPKSVTTVQQFIADQGWFIPQSKAESDNLLAALQTPLPESPPLGNYWGFLSTPLALSTEQRGAVTQYIKKNIGSEKSLLAYLGTAVPQLSNDPAKALEQLLRTDEAQALAANLQTQMKGAPTTTSPEQWLLTALVLELDATAGTRRNTVAGFDFTQSGNWGLEAHSIRERFNQHLISDRQVPANLAPAAARLLMAGTAPHLLVKDMPSLAFFSSIEWVAFATAVNRIEWKAPGAAANMTFQQVMDFHKIRPISAPEVRLETLAQANPVRDWATASNPDTHNETAEYTPERHRISQEKLDKQISETSDAINYLRSVEPPNRRDMALKALREKFGTGIDYERADLWESFLGGTFSGLNASIVEVYEAGRLGERWTSPRPELDVATLRAGAHELPDINAQFNEAIEKDHALRRQHNVTLFKDMLSKLPLADRDSLVNGSVKVFQVKGDGNGILLTSNYQGIDRTFAIYPALRKIVKVPDIDRSIPEGTIGPQTLDAAAFKNGAEPKPGVKSNVAITRIDETDFIVPKDDPTTGIRTLLLPYSTTQDASNYDSARTQYLSKLLVDSIYLNKANFIAGHTDQRRNRVENGVEPIDALKGILRVIPGGSSVLDIIEGKYAQALVDLVIDIVMFVATEGVGKLWTLAKSGASWAGAKVSAGLAERFAAKETESIALRDITTTSAQESLPSLSRMQGQHIAEQTADMANGSVARSGPQAQVKVTAVMREGNWYAYDAEAGAAYGPALEGFRADASIGLTPEILPDGTSIRVPDRLLPEDAQVINRSTYSDVKIGNKVYRYDPKKPEVLTDLESADHFNDTHDLEAFCPAGPRVKRQTDGVCFAKVVSDFSSNTARMVQGLEHTRLYPSPGGAGLNSTLVYERRLFDVVEKDGVYTTVQRQLQDPIEYLPTTRGTIVKDPYFGLPGTQPLANLEQNTRIVKLGPISSASNDQRELRATITVIPTTAAGDRRFMVVEADPLTFYYVEFNADSTVLEFKKIGEPQSLLESVLATKHTLETETLLELAGAPLRKEFVSLPTLDSAFAKLQSAGYTPGEVSELKNTVATFSEEKKREFVYQLINKLDNSNGRVVLKSANIDPLIKAGNFADLSVNKQNKFYADGAKDAVDAQVKATGIGSQNKRTPYDLNDLYREQVAGTLVSWIQNIKVASPAYANSVLKFGAGNCEEMAEAAAQIIKKSGGDAKTWYVHGGDHAFTVVGGPASAGKSTVDFSEIEWKDAWIVDPWAEISCKASEYTGLLRRKMDEWDAKGLQIYTSGDWRSPRYPEWVDGLTTLEKRPL